MFKTEYICFMCLVTVGFTIDINSWAERGQDVVLSRRRRYLAFPEGSTFVVTLCATVKTIMRFELFYEGINWGTAYTLPNVSTVQEYAKNKNKERRRQRRDLYGRFEKVIDSMGFDGRSCIFRALCEAARKFGPKTSRLSEDFLRILFKFPLQSLSDDEPEEHRLYHWAYRRGRQEKQQDCSDMFPGCSISLIDLALGYYESNEET